MDDAVVHTVGQQFLLRHGRTALYSAGVTLTEGDVAGRVLVEQRIVEQNAPPVDGAGRRHQRDLADAAGAFIGVQQLAIFAPLPAGARLIIMHGNGIESARLRNGLGMDIYFADPYSS